MFTLQVNKFKILKFGIFVYVFNLILGKVHKKILNTFSNEHFY